MVEMSATIDAGDLGRLDYALREYASALGKDCATAPRRAAIQICKSFRAASATKKAPKYARSGEYTITKSDTRPKYITAKDGRKLRRWTLDRSPVGRGVYDVYAEKRTDVRKKRLILARAGLARRSWGWVMHNLFVGAAPDDPWRRRKRDRRNPKDAVSESTATAQAGTPLSSGYARISNRLDYIRDALNVSEDAVMAKAKNWMLKQVELRRMRRG